MYVLVDSPVGTSFIRNRPEHFTETAELDPHGVAVSSGDRSLTFAEVDAWSTTLSQLLVDMGAGTDNHVVMALPPSIESVVAMWAVAKTGAALASIDPAESATMAGIVVSGRRVCIGLTTRAQLASLPDSIAWLVVDESASRAGGSVALVAA